jgi:hypothetical protein
VEVREKIRVRRTSVLFAALALTTVGLAGVASSAGASYHEMKIREVSAGNGTADTSYIEVQAYAPGQNYLSLGAKLAVCINPSCIITPAEYGGFTIVASGANQMTVVFGDTAVPANQKDFTVPDLDLEDGAAGGAACYVSEPGFADCVSWGNFGADAVLSSNYGTVAGPPAPALTAGSALRRSIAPGCPTLLEPADDSNNSAADFAVTAQNPRPNSVPPTEAACAGTAPTQPSGTGAKKKKKCKKRKGSSTKPGTGSGPANPPGYAAKKKCKKKKRK